MLEQLQAILRDFLEDTSLQLKPEMNLLMDLGLDSYDLIALVGVVEESIGLEIPDRVMMEIFTVGDIVNYLEKQGR